MASGGSSLLPSHPVPAGSESLRSPEPLLGPGLLLALKHESRLVALIAAATAAAMASLLGYSARSHDPAELRGVDETHHAIARDKGPAVKTALDPFVPLDSDGVVARAVRRGARLVAMQGCLLGHLAAAFAPEPLQRHGALEPHFVPKLVLVKRFNQHPLSAGHGELGRRLVAVPPRELVGAADASWAPCAGP